MTTPYRDDFDAATEKLEALEQELTAVKTRANELSNLTKSEIALAAEVVALKARLERMAQKRALPLLESVRIASPCKADWNEMVGDSRVRFCGSCEKNVYNLSDMPRDEAERFVRESADSACVRLYRRADGTVMTGDCPVGRKRKRMRNVVLAVVGGGMLAAGALFSWRPRAPIATTGEMIAMGKPEQGAPVPTEAPSNTGTWIAGGIGSIPTSAPVTTSNGLVPQPLPHAQHRAPGVSTQGGTR